MVNRAMVYEGDAEVRSSRCAYSNPKIRPEGMPVCNAVLNTPVIYILFNRPDVVRKTFPAIRAQKPRRLYLIADGPRPNRPADQERCHAARKAVEDMLDWDCEIIRDYSDANLGAGKRIASGLTAALAILGEAIIVEDDILTTPDFFTFCADMLARYRDDPSVHGISGYNPIGQYLPRERRAVPALTHITWGWATWNRAWQSYRGNLEGWENPDVKEAIRSYVSDSLYFDELQRSFRVVEKREVDAWDYQWVFTMLYERRHAIVSSVNLVENLGFMPDATHTFHKPAFAYALETYSSPSSPPPTMKVAVDRVFDRLHWKIYLDGSRAKIALLRWAARHSRALTAALNAHPVSTKA